MKRAIIIWAVLLGLQRTCFAQISWKKVAGKATDHSDPSAPLHSTAFATDEALLKAQLFAIGNASEKKLEIALPLPDGTSKIFTVRETPIMPGKLAARYPEIRTFTAIAAGNAAITAKLDYTLFGFHAMIFDGSNTALLDPDASAGQGYYTAHYKKDEVRSHSTPASVCQVHNETSSGINNYNTSASRTTADQRVINGYQRRTYRIALSANNQYCKAATGLSTPTIAQALSKMTTSMNRLNGVYERECAITMVFVANEDTLIWPSATGSKNGDDPFNTINDDAGPCLAQNQLVCDTLIGTANYDIGHVFTTGAGGLSQVGVVCHQGMKAQSVTGFSTVTGDAFDIDYVAHEMGHEFGANHPFNNGKDKSCAGGNIYPETAYEPGSGSTIMAYAGICPPDDIQPHSDDYFHAVSLLEIQKYITTPGAFGGDGCPVRTSTGNKVVSIPAFTAKYTIPYLTPFELLAPVATDSVSSSSVTYCWEQWNLGDPGLRLIETQFRGPIFRSFHQLPPRFVFSPLIVWCWQGS